MVGRGGDSVQVNPGFRNWVSRIIDLFYPSLELDFPLSLKRVPT